jgi:hypothetical protein
MNVRLTPRVIAFVALLLAAAAFLLAAPAAAAGTDPACWVV